jgi:ubiquinone/menaquinone biosynthesis C-methylase UbiE
MLIALKKHKEGNSIEDRFEWAASLLNPADTDHILEIGCGTGILVEKLAAVLSKGRILAIDKSVSLTSAAQRRNKRFIESGVVQLLVQDYTASSFHAQQFDKAIAFNVSAFWEKPTLYLPHLKRHLKPNGTFYLFYQPPFDKTQELAQKAAAILTANHFSVEQVHMQTFKPAPAFCIICAPK